MPTSFTIDSSKRLVSVQVRGLLTRDEAMSLATQIRDHPTFDFLFSEILDLSTLDDSRLEYQDLVLISDRYDPFSLWSKRAFITGGSGAAHELARMYRMIRKGASIEVFSCSHDAVEWLDRVAIRRSSPGA